MSDELKDDKILIPLIQSINSLSKNKTFEKMNFNIIVFEEKNETIRIIEPIGKFQFKENLPFAFIYKQDNKYEPLFYKYLTGKLPFLKYQKDQCNHKLLIFDNSYIMKI